MKLVDWNIFYQVNCAKALLLAFRVYKYTAYASITYFQIATMYRDVSISSDCQQIILNFLKKNNLYNEHNIL